MGWLAKLCHVLSVVDLWGEFAMEKRVASGNRRSQAPDRALRQSDIPFLFLLNAEHGYPKKTSGGGPIRLPTAPEI